MTLIFNHKICKTKKQNVFEQTKSRTKVATKTNIKTINAVTRLPRIKSQ